MQCRTVLSLVEGRDMGAWRNDLVDTLQIFGRKGDFESLERVFQLFKGARSE